MAYILAVNPDILSNTGKTGLTSLTTAALFLIALFFAPLFTMMPPAATSAALVLVGFFMMSPILKINFHDFTEAIPAFITIIIMPLTYSIAEGIVFGMLSFVFIKLLTGRIKDISLVMIVLAVLFILKFFL
jgi:adenine/guanine/hypoxanthine permease